MRGVLDGDAEGGELVADRVCGGEVLTGTGGLALVERERPAALFTDRWMPNLDGFQLCAAVKANPALAHIPVVLISASLQPDERDDALRKGFAAILHKPFGPADLRALVERVVPTAERP